MVLHGSRPRVASPPAASERGLRCPHSLADTRSCLCSILPILGGGGISSVVSVCISLLTTDGGHLSVSSLAGCTSLEMCLFQSFAHFTLGGLFSLLSCRKSLYILDSKPSPGVRIGTRSECCSLPAPWDAVAPVLPVEWG